MCKNNSLEKSKELFKKTLVAIENPYKSVNYVFRNIVDTLDEKNIDQVHYVGVKDVEQIPRTLVTKLANSNFLLHTLDAHSLGGRAIDVNLMNPITAKPMTGSSSGTAINVFAGINDLGIGTDGGGSVLAPSMALNLFGLICPLIEQDEMKKYNRKSTDGIEFYPSIGLISKRIDLIEKGLSVLLETEFKEVETDAILASKKVEGYKDVTEFPNSTSSRNEMINFLNEHLSNYDCLIDIEGPIDTEGFGDTVFGHFDDKTKIIQENANKCLSKVANMVKATSIVVPTGKLATSYILICESKKEKIEKMLTIAKRINYKEDQLIESYFADLSKYIKKGYF